MRAGRRAAATLIALVAAVAMTGCAPAVPLANVSVLTINASRARYLDALCPLRASDAFWTAAASPAAAAAELASAEPAVRGLAKPPKPYPRLLRPSMERLVAVLEGNREYFASAAAAPDAAAVRELDPPSAQPTATIAEVESIVTVAAAPGSGNCTGHLPPTPTPS